MLFWGGSSGHDLGEHSKGVTRNVILIFTGAAVRSVLIYHLSQTKSSCLFCQSEHTKGVARNVILIFTGGSSSFSVNLSFITIKKFLFVLPN